jgi:hypothetical protein
MKHPCRTILRSMLFMLAVFILGGNDLLAHVARDNTVDPIAEMKYSFLLEFQPDDIKVRNKPAMVLYRLDKLDEAFVELQRVLELNPDTV